jgi:hypothetical protein
VWGSCRLTLWLGMGFVSIAEFSKNCVHLFCRLILNFEGDVDWCWGTGDSPRGHVIRRIIQTSVVAGVGAVLTALVIVSDPSHGDYEDGDDASYHGCDCDCGCVQDRVGYEVELHGVIGWRCR